MKRVTIALIVFAVLVIGAAIAIGLALGLRDNDDDDDDDKGSDASGGTGKYKDIQSGYGTFNFASVAADNDICSWVGTEIMAKKGGSATDAAIASLICLGVVNPQHVGVGSGVLMVIYDTPKGGTQKELSALIGRESAPVSFSSRDMYKDDPDAHDSGPLSIGVPGEVNGYKEAWEKYGRVEWKDLWAPAIKMAREGWPVSNSMEASLVLAKDWINDYPTLKEQFVKADGTLYKEGEIMKNEKYADTLEKIAENGAAEFYTGQLARDIAADIQEQGGEITYEDMGAQKALLNEPLKTTLQNGDFTVHAPSPPSSGIMVAFILNVMDGYNYKKDSIKTDADRTLYFHRMIEAWKLALARRNYIGDPEFANAENQIDEWLTKLQSDEYAEEVRQLIDDDSTLEYPGGYEPVSGSSSPDLAHTSHMCVYGPDGSAVSTTSTVGSLFGSRVRGSKTGIVFNNLMELFKTPAMTNITANMIEPGKRGLSSTSPSLIMDKDGAVRLIVGGSGSQRIITASTYIAMENLWFGKDVIMALDGPRIHHQFDAGNTLYYDEELSESLRDALKKKGHENLTPHIQKWPYLAVEQAIDPSPCNNATIQNPWVRDPCIHAVSDWRKGGVPGGY